MKNLVRTIIISAIMISTLVIGAAFASADTVDSGECKTIEKNAYDSNRFKTVTAKTQYHTKDGYVYLRGVKVGNYMYVAAANHIYKVNVKAFKKSKFATRGHSGCDAVMGLLSANDGYIYFTSGAAQWNDPDNPSYLYRKKISGGNIQKIGRCSNYKIVGKMIYAQYTVNNTYYGESDTDDYYYYKCNLDGSNQTILKTYSDGEYHDNVNVKCKSYNVKGYKTIQKDYIKKWTHKMWLVKTSNNKKVYLGEFTNY